MTGIAVTSGPWLLTSMVLVLMRVAASRSEVVGLYQVELIITLVYASVLVFTAPTNIILSRFTSDLVYDDEPTLIAAPVRRVLGLTLVAMALLGVAIMLLLKVSLVLTLGGAMLMSIVAGQWVLLSLAGGLSSPGIILKSFAVGAPSSVIAALILSQRGPEGYLFGFAIGQVITMGILYVGSFRCLPATEDESSSIRPAMKHYRLLGASAITLQAGIWIDKLIAFDLRGAGFASSYAAMAALSWLTVVPTSAYLFVLVETSFYRSFRSFYDGIERGAPLEELDIAAGKIDADTRRTLLSTAALQLFVTVLALALAGRITASLGLDTGTPWTARLLLIGAALQIVSLCATLLLCYFDFQWEAMFSAAVLLFANIALTYGLEGLLPLGTGYAVAAGLSSVAAIVLLRMRLSNLVRDTYQSQPYGSEG